MMDVITYPCWDLSSTILLKEVPDVFVSRPRFVTIMTLLSHCLLVCIAIELKLYCNVRWASSRLRSPSNWLFVQRIARLKNTQSQHYWPLLDIQWIPLTKRQKCGLFFPYHDVMVQLKYKRTIGGHFGQWNLTQIAQVLCMELFTSLSNVLQWYHRVGGMCEFLAIGPIRV